MFLTGTKQLPSLLIKIHCIKATNLFRNLTISKNISSISILQNLAVLKGGRN